MKRLLALVYLLTPGMVLAHPGHLAGEQVHGFLHSEHIVILIAIVGLVYLLNFIRNK